MAIDYNRRPKPAPSTPAPNSSGLNPATPPASSGPSWYRPPEEEEAEQASVPPPAAGAYPPPPPLPGTYPPPSPPTGGHPAPPVPPSGYPPPGGHPAPGGFPAPGGYPAPGAAPAGGYPAPGAAPTGGYPAPGGYPPPAPAGGQPAPGGYPAPGGFPAPGGYPPPGAGPTGGFAPPSPPPAAPAGGGVSLSKVTLSKSAPQVSLTKSGGAAGIIRVNLNWSAGAAAPTGGGFFKRLAASANRGVDLDLGCLYELSDGSKGVIQALGNAFGSLHSHPFIQLDGDDRSGTNTAGENMSINLEQPGRFRRILIFAMIYEGAPNWAAVDGVVTLSPLVGPQIEVRMDATSDQARICAVAQLLYQGGDLVVQREVQYINGGQSVLDRQYGWGMNWTPGRK